MHIQWYPSLTAVSYCFRVCGCSDTCISDQNGSEWFKQRYNDTQQPILRDSGNNFDPDALKWWLVRTKGSGSSDSIKEDLVAYFQLYISTIIIIFELKIISILTLPVKYIAESLKGDTVLLSSVTGCGSFHRKSLQPAPWLWPHSTALMCQQWQSANQLNRWAFS